MDRKKRTIAILSLLALNPKKRRCWVREIYKNRRLQGASENLIEEMRLSDTESFFNFLRMTPAQFDHLLTLVGPIISKNNRNYRDSIQAKDRLALTLRFLASGDLMVSLSYQFRIGRSTPSSAKWLAIANKYFAKWQFPNCIGAIDGKHVLIQAPPNTGSQYHNYKGGFSIILLASVDADYKFVLVDIGSEGHNSDGGVFRHSVISQAIECNQLNIPNSAALPSTKTVMPFVFVGDEAFPLKNYLMRPFPGNALSKERRIFNYRLSRARRCVENAFGIMAARFRIFRKPITTSVETCKAIVAANVCLHNFLKLADDAMPPLKRRYCPPGFSDTLSPNGDTILGLWRQEKCALKTVGRFGSNMHTKSAGQLRENFMQYFCSVGQLEWQDHHVLDAGRAY
ncbi:protein ALP1-like [Caerostris darwini]|uniref:Protein ALP1-like n=1 Tax=Caerostris darwini TaxID=1538125 RepID=A0AAV4T312_9ARAC|nr:protein ALP1-like [Caerostris darwini]